MQNMGLSDLCFYLNNMNPSNFEELLLSSLDLGSSCEDLCAMIKANTSLKRLKVLNCHYHYSSFNSSKLAEAIALHSNLEELQLIGIHLSRDFIGLLAPALKNTKIKKLI